MTQVTHMTKLKKIGEILMNYLLHSKKETSPCVTNYQMYIYFIHAKTDLSNVYISFLQEQSSSAWTAHDCQEIITLPPPNFILFSNITLSDSKISNDKLKS